RTLFRHCFVRETMPPGAIEPSTRIGVWPDTNTRSPHAIPCEYGPIARGAFGVMMGFRFMASPQRREQLFVGLELAHQLGQRLDGLEIAQAGEVAAQFIDAVEVLLREQLLFFARPAVPHFQGRE